MKGTLQFFLILALAACVSCQRDAIPSDDLPKESGTNNHYVPGKAVIKVSDQLARNLESDASAAEIMPGVTVSRTFSHGGRYEERMRKCGLHLWYDVDFDVTTPLTKTGESLMHVDGVEAVEFVPVKSVSGGTAPFDDPQLKKQWHYNNSGNPVTGLVEGCDINLFPAWERGVVGNENVIVAVIDGGVDFNHEDLKSNMWQGQDENGKPICGYDFVYDSYIVNGEDHGTHVAGTIAAVNNNGIGVGGIAGGDAARGIKGVRIMSCQIFSGDKGGNAADAIVWAANHGAIIAQNSWGYTKEENPDMTETPKYERDAIDYFNQYAGCDENGGQLPDSPMKGGVVIFAAGNESLPTGFPASYPGCIAVSSIAGDSKLAYYSNYGDWVDIAAPGGDQTRNQAVYSTITGNNYGGFQGTSMACPHVSGVAALIVSEFGGAGFTREDLIDRLLRTAADISLPKTEMGAGMVDAAAAVARYGEYLPELPAFAAADVLSGTEIRLKYVIPEDNHGVKCSKVDLLYGKEAFAEDGEGIIKISESTRKLHAGDTLEFRVGNLDLNTEYFFSVRAYDIYDNASPLSDNEILTTQDNLAPVIVANDGLDFSFKQYMNPRITFRVYDPENALKDVRYENATDYDKLSVNGDVYTVMIDARSIQPGAYSSRLVAEDALGKTSESIIQFVIEENNAPALSVQMENVLFTSRSKSRTIDLSGYFSDEDGETLTYTATSSDEAVVKTSIIKNVLTLNCSDFGQAEILVKAEDALGEYAQSSFMVVSRDGSMPYDLYPNPVTDGKLHVRSSSGEEVTISIGGASGAVIYDDKIVPDPFNPALVDMSDAAAGVYSVRITDGSGKVFTQNIVKL